MAHKVVEISWIDSASARGWMSHAEAVDWADNMPRLKSFGVVIRENDESVLFCSGIDQNPHRSDVREMAQYNGVHIIPKSAITHMRVLTEIE